MIVKSVLLPCPPADAFTLFTARTGDWWPVSHRPSRDGTSRIQMLAEGRFFERTAAGVETDLGRVLVWQPPHRLELAFYPGTGPAHPTRVLVTFVAEGGGTRVTVDHQAGPAGSARWTAHAPVFSRSWDVVLGALSAAASPRDSGDGTL